MTPSKILVLTSALVMATLSTTQVQATAFFAVNGDYNFYTRVPTTRFDTRIPTNIELIIEFMSNIEIQDKNDPISIFQPTINNATPLGHSINSAALKPIGPQLTGLTFQGAHHLPLLSQHGLNNDHGIWVNGDIGYYDRDRDANVTIAEIGAYHDFLPNKFRAGLGVGKSYMSEDFELSGDSHMQGEYMLAEVDYLFSNLPVIASLIGFYGSWDANIDRGYQIVDTIYQSRGKTNIKTYSIRTRLDWINAYSYNNITLSPKLEYTATQTKVDSYTEIGGILPAHFNSQSHTTNELRLGVNANKSLKEKTNFRGMIEIVHRFDNDTPTISGELIGVTSFSLSEEKNKETWGRIGFEIDHEIAQGSFFSISVNASSTGEDPDFSGAISLKKIL